MTEATRWVVFDVEADDLFATKIHCLSWKDYDGDRGTLTDYQDIRDFFTRYEMYVGHNIRRWDIPTLFRLLGIKVPDNLVDSLGVAWYLEPLRAKHGIESYGEDFGIHKPKVTNWSDQPLEVYIHRCETDVEINYRLWKKQSEYLTKLYPDWGDFWRFLRYLDFKLYSALLAEESGWKLDERTCHEALEHLTAERDRKTEALRRAMPPVPVVRTYNPPKRLYNADGQLSALGQRWQERLAEAGLPEGHADPIDVVVEFVDGNPGSHQQIKDWLFSLGWRPKTFKYKRNKETGEVREIPQINLEPQHGGGVCESVKDLYEVEPSLELLDGYFVLNHRISILNGFLRDSHDGMLHARVAGLTNTLRFKHAELVNLPKPEKQYAESIRACLVAPSAGHELCGSDMASLEDRIKQHFLYPHDPDYVDQLNSSDYDPHLDIAVLAGGLSQEDADRYKRGEDQKTNQTNSFGL